MFDPAVRLPLTESLFADAVEVVVQPLRVLQTRDDRPDHQDQDEHQNQSHDGRHLAPPEELHLVRQGPLRRGGFGSAGVRVNGTHTEIVDPYRSGLAGEADCAF